MPLPAYDTKQQQVLTYTIADRTFHIHQNDISGETGSTLWLSAQVLSQYFVATFGRANTLAAPSVLELGSGTGLTALVLNSLGFKVTATDISSICKSTLTPNLLRNRNGDLDSGIEVHELDWFQSDAENLLITAFDLIVASDVVYESSLVPGLCDTILKVTRHGTVVYIAQEVRDPGLFEYFMLRLHDGGLSSSRISHVKLRKIMRDSQWKDDAWEGVVIWKFRRKGRVL